MESLVNYESDDGDTKSAKKGHSRVNTLLQKQGNYYN